MYILLKALYEFTCLATYSVLLDVIELDTLIVMVAGIELEAPPSFAAKSK